LGTVDYMAPEQWLDSRVDIRADVYSLGCTLYHLLAGRPPFAGPECDTYGQKLMAHARAPVPPLHARRPEVPDGLAAVLERLLAKQPDARWATPAEVAAALQPFTPGCDLPRLLRAVGATPTVPANPGMPPAASPGKTLSPPPERKPLSRSRAVFATLAAVTLIATLGLVGQRLFEPVRIDSMEIEHFSDEKPYARPLGILGSPPLRRIQADERVRVHAGLSRPSYCYLITYHPDGRTALCYPKENVPATARCEQLVYPSEKLFKLDEGIGMQAFILVASRKPLPPFADCQPAVSSPWQKAEIGCVWCFDGQRFQPLDGRHRTEEELPPVPKPFEDVCHFLKNIPEVEAIRAVAFPVEPKPEKGSP
jgi:hypothetical protein